MVSHLTHEDLLILEMQRLERFRSLFADALSLCFLHLDRGNELKIHCSEPWLVDLLLHKIEPLCASAWIVVGADQLSIYYAQEEIYIAPTRTQSKRSRRSVNSRILH
ncbi:MAG: hypothetical protein NW224_11515 [Leptolyngbyaceae cyanobacterium bins.302]|nr:hypothetical protein [Leptolyngbyaceae cyanobacterium bins.302]